jgi:hypothetical protein
MSNAMRKGSLLLILAAICAATLVSSPACTYATTSGASTGGSSWTDGSAGGGTGSGTTNNGDPDNPIPGKTGGNLMTTPGLSDGPRQSVSVGYSVTVSSVSLRGWLQPIYWMLRIHLGW